jgi:hypothetical protein
VGTERRTDEKRNRNYRRSPAAWSWSEAAGFSAGDELTVAYEGRFDDTGFSEINEEIGKRICEKLCQKFNAPWERPNDYAGPTMSIGDVVTLFLGNGAILSFACERQGFRKLASDLPLDMFISEYRPTKWTRTPAQMKEYLKTKRDDGYDLTVEEDVIVYGSY